MLPIVFTVYRAAGWGEFHKVEATADARRAAAFLHPEERGRYQVYGPEGRVTAERLWRLAGQAPVSVH